MVDFISNGREFFETGVEQEIRTLRIVRICMDERLVSVQLVRVSVEDEGFRNIPSHIQNVLTSTTDSEMKCTMLLIRNDASF